MVLVRRSIHSTTMEQRAKRVAVIAAVLLALLLVTVAMNSAESAIVELEPTSVLGAPSPSLLDLEAPRVSDSSLKKIGSALKAPETKVDLSSFEGCTVAEILQPDVAPANVPFWMPSYPDTHNGVVSALVSELTGAKSSAKSYYASSPGLKKCFSSSLTVTCEQIHPIVAIGPPPEQQAHKFQPKIIFPIRNPLTVIPEHFQSKAVKYHGVQGQVSIAVWREFRDTWLEATVVEGWKSVVTTWKNMTQYQGVGLYLPYEHLMDVEKGPALTSRLAAMIREAGFPVVAESDIPCVWYRTVKGRLQAPHKLYEYAIDYIPGYTAHQMEYMAAELTRFQKLYPDDTALVAILKEYVNEIQQTPAIDQPWNNITARG